MIPVSREQERGSLEGRTWVDSGHGYGLQSIQSLCEALNVSEPFGHVLAARDLIDPEEARRFLDPSPDQEALPVGAPRVPGSPERVDPLIWKLRCLLGQRPPVWVIDITTAFCCFLIAWNFHRNRGWHV